MTAIIFRRRGLGNYYSRSLAAAMEAEVQVYTNRATRRQREREGHWPGSAGTVFRLGCTARIPGPHGTVVNSADAIHLVNDKRRFRMVLDENRLCPTLYTMDELRNCDMPVVVRPSQHSRGQHFWVCHNMGDILEARDLCRAMGLHGYISELIDKAAEYRVFVVQGRVVWVAQKIPSDATQIAWNHTNGATFSNVRWGDWPLRAVRVAIEGFNLSGLDFGGVDVIVDHEGRPYIVEINSAATGESPYRTECTARAFDYIVRNGKARIPLIEERGGWRKFIHPSISTEALVP